MLALCAVPKGQPGRPSKSLTLAQATAVLAAAVVFTSAVGTELDAANVRRTFRRTVKATGLDPTEWTPRELRHSFVSPLSDDGVTLEEISPLVGHAGTVVTEAIYRHQLRPVILKSATAMDRILAPGPAKPSDSLTQSRINRNRVHLSMGRTL